MRHSEPTYSPEAIIQAIGQGNQFGIDQAVQCCENTDLNNRLKRLQLLDQLYDLNLQAVNGPTCYLYGANSTDWAKLLRPMIQHANKQKLRAGILLLHHAPLKPEPIQSVVDDFIADLPSNTFVHAIEPSQYWESCFDLLYALLLVYRQAFDVTIVVVQDAYQHGLYFQQCTGGRVCVLDEHSRDLYNAVLSGSIAWPNMMIYKPKETKQPVDHFLWYRQHLRQQDHVSPKQIDELTWLKFDRGTQAFTIELFDELDRLHNQLTPGWQILEATTWLKHSLVGQFGIQGFDALGGDVTLNQQIQSKSPFKIFDRMAFELEAALRENPFNTSRSG